MKIGEIANQQNQDKMKLKYGILNIITLIFIICNIAWLIYVVKCSLNDNIDTFNIPLLFAGIDFFICGFLFALTGLKMLMRLKAYFPEFYKENSKKLIIATVGLSFPLLCRGVIDTTRYVIPSFN